MSLGAEGSDGPIIPDKIIIDAPETVGTEFAVALRTLLIERTTDDWLFWFAALLQFIEREGHASPETKHRERFRGESLKLRQWINVQRNWNNAGKLRRDRFDLLDAVEEWDWDPHATTWDKHFAALLQFIEREGHGSPSADHIEEFRERNSRSVDGSIGNDGNSRLRN